jgi:hypothetical protein
MLRIRTQKSSLKCVTVHCSLPNEFNKTYALTIGSKKALSYARVVGENVIPAEFRAFMPGQTQVNLAVSDIHVLLKHPDRLAETLRDLSYADVAQVVNHLAAHLNTARTVDSVGVIEEMMFVCTGDRTGQSSMRSFSRAVAAFVAACMQRVATEDTEVLIDFVQSVPLVVGLDFLCTMGMAYGLVQGADHIRVADAPRFTADINLIEDTIDIWRERARRAIVSGYIIEEGDLFVVLDGLAHLGIGSKDEDAIAAFREFCVNVPGGLEHFLEEARPYKEPQREVFFLHVWDADAMADLVEASPHAGQFFWYVEQPRTDAHAREFVEKRNKA